MVVIEIIQTINLASYSLTVNFHSNLLSKLWCVLHISETGSLSMSENLPILVTHHRVTCSLKALQDMTAVSTSTLSFSLCQACCEYRTCVHCACDWFCGSSGCGSAAAAGLSVEGMLIRSWSISWRTSSCQSAHIIQLLKITPTT